MTAQVQKTGFRKKFIGNKAFYSSVLAVSVPIMIQNGISNFVSMLDNIMVGRVGTAQMSGVSIVNQLMFVYFLCIFGGLGGVGIFTAQYYGNKDEEGIRRTFRFKIWLALIITAIAAVIFILFAEPLIGLYLKGEGDSAAEIAATLQYGMGYLNIVLLSLPAFMLLQIYASTIRACGETVLPMKAGVVAGLVNLVFNYLLIFGKFGFPEMGVYGAAVATVLSRYVEAAIVVIWVHTHKARNSWIHGAYRTILVPLPIVQKFILKGMPLLANEALWSIAQAMLTQCYSLRGLNVIVAFNIANTLGGMLNIVFFSMGDAVSIMVGQQLGAGDTERAVDTDNKIIFFAVIFSVIAMIAFMILAPFFPRFYNTSDAARQLATNLMIAQAAFYPLFAFCHCTYFTLRSGGKTVVTFLFDSAFNCAISVPVAFVLSRFTGIPAVGCYVIVTACDFIKAIIGYVLLKKGVWINNIVADDKA